MPYSKIVIIVDEYVDPFNLEQVMWALTTRVKPSKDVIVIPNCSGMVLDPSSNPAGMHDKLIIDATTPVAPEPNPRSCEMLVPSPATPKWEEILRQLQLAAQKK
jgi:3-polyprenyl-4-hydroxybenzoate decarboxylase